jgi:heme/copper-type cytochrome/quinol oxidase subunit 4
MSFKELLPIAFIALASIFSLFKLLIFLQNLAKKSGGGMNHLYLIFEVFKHP